MPDINIDYTKAADVAGRIRAQNRTLTQTLNRIKETITRLENEYQSDSGEAIRSAITAMQPKFNSYEQVIESYAKFLDNMVQQNRDREAVHTQNAQRFIGADQ